MRIQHSFQHNRQPFYNLYPFFLDAPAFMGYIIGVMKTTRQSNRKGKTMSHAKNANIAWDAMHKFAELNGGTIEFGNGSPKAFQFRGHAITIQRCDYGTSLHVHDRTGHIVTNLLF